MAARPGQRVRPANVRPRSDGQAQREAVRLVRHLEPVADGQHAGGIHGHPKGTRAGAQATMQAIEAWQEGVTLEEKAKKAQELREALGKWGHYKPV